MEPDDYLTAPEAAAIMGVHRSRVASLCKAGDIPHITAGAGEQRPIYLIRRADAEAWRARVVPDTTGGRRRGRPAGAKDMHQRTRTKKEAAQ